MKFLHQVTWRKFQGHHQGHQILVTCFNIFNGLIRLKEAPATYGPHWKDP